MCEGARTDFLSEEIPERAAVCCGYAAVRFVRTTVRNCVRFGFIRNFPVARETVSLCVRDEGKG